MIGLITYLSIVIGELVPKQLALRHPEGIACAVAPFMLVLSKIAAPAVWLLNASTRLIFGLFGSPSDGDNTVTEEEIKMLVGEAESAGVIEEEERRMQGVACFFHVPRRAGDAGLQPQRHQLMVGGVEFHFVDAPAIAVVGVEHRGDAIGLRAPRLRFGAAHARAERCQTFAMDARA